MRITLSPAEPITSKITGQQLVTRVGIWFEGSIEPEATVSAEAFYNPKEIDYYNRRPVSVYAKLQAGQDVPVELSEEAGDDH